MREKYWPPGLYVLQRIDRYSHSWFCNRDRFWGFSSLRRIRYCHHSRGCNIRCRRHVQLLLQLAHRYSSRQRNCHWRAGFYRNCIDSNSYSCQCGTDRNRCIFRMFRSLRDHIWQRKLSGNRQCVVRKSSKWLLHLSSLSFSKGRSCLQNTQCCGKNWNSCFWLLFVSGIC